ncbi:uncharacterized protein N7515_004830 [Penicillium bovifimosum]|uniref:Uncharacterized protein n=1 Tax=Penicillium bovifimosum TaxID=126998 RepID=A0A9W9H0W2_9EURO|nr:uncharacterized protein N7515_004830 [Penicillium bovifimosum]KAJ5135552.1 hypothetical protein N7515_004830 [Penicillium bovifimosum]
MVCDVNRLTLPDERDRISPTFFAQSSTLNREPGIPSCILEYFYKGDYYPRLLHKHRASWTLEDARDINETGGCRSSEPTIFHPGVDTVVYCAAKKYGLEELKRLALRKQGLQSGISADVILRSARYHTVCI